MKQESEFSYESKLFQECLTVPIKPSIRQLLNQSRCTAWIASGLSRVAAECGRRMLQEWVGIPGRVFTPLDYCSSNISEYLPVLVSYRGRNLDIQSVGKSIVRASIKQVLLFAGREKTKIRTELENEGVRVHAICPPPHVEDKRFVAVLPTWAMTAMALRLAQSFSHHHDRKALCDIAKAAYQEALHDGRSVAQEFQGVPDCLSRKWIVMGSGPTLPALVAWEGMCGESGLTSIVITDLKDYTHGRYLSAIRERNVGFIILTSQMDATLGRILKKRLSQHFPVMEIASKQGMVFDLCKHLFLVPFFVSELATANGWSIARPPKPALLDTWRTWGKIPVSG